MEAPMADLDDWTKRLRLRQMAERRATAEANAQAERAAAKAQTIPPEPLEAVKVQARDLATGRMVEIGVTVRRRSDAALWDWIAKQPDYERAAARIGAAFTALDRGLGLQESALARAMRGDPGGPGGPDYLRRLNGLLADYFDWGRECTRRGISHAAAMDVLGYAKSCRQVERERRKRNGWARENLDDALALFCALRGWRKAA
jgi:hypothetical protein